MKTNRVGTIVLRAIVLLATIVALGVAPLSVPAEPAAKKTSPQQNAKGKDLYGLVWQRARPAQHRSIQPSSSRVSAVAGIRGSKQENKLSPYWKSKVKITDDLREFSEISTLVNKGQYEPAAEKFKEWIGKYNQSKYTPQAKLGLAICYAFLDRKDDAKVILDQWLKDYPGNDMEDAVKQLVADLSSAG